MITAPKNVLAKSLDLVKNRPTGGNAHPSMLRNRYVSASRLVRCPARALIREILEDEAARPDDELHWGRNGNALAAMNLARVPCKEPTLRVPLPCGPYMLPARTPMMPWSLDGHPDGLDLLDPSGARWGFQVSPGPSDDPKLAWWASLFENKAPLHEPDAQQLHLYYLQGLLYLGMLIAMKRTGSMSLMPAEWPDAPKGPGPGGSWTLPHRIEAAQVVVAVQPYSAAESEEAFTVTTEAALEHLEHYIQKACVVVKGVLADDAEIGGEWDDVKGKGLGEFLAGLVPILDDADFLAVAEERERLKSLRDQVEGDWERVTLRLKSHLLGVGLDKVRVGGATVSLTRKKGGVVHFIRAPNVEVRVTGSVKPKDTAVEPPAQAVA